MSHQRIHLEIGSQDAYALAANRVTGDTLGVWRGTTKSPLPTKRRRWWQRWSSPPRTIEEAIDCGRRLIEAQCAIDDELSSRIEAKMQELVLRREAMRELDAPQIAPAAVANGGAQEPLASPDGTHTAPRALAKVRGS